MKNMKKSNIGRWCLIKAFGVMVGGTIMDVVSGSGKAKRVRIQTGEHAGEVVQGNQYEFIEYAN